MFPPRHLPGDPLGLGGGPGGTLGPPVGRQRRSWTSFCRSLAAFWRPRGRPGTSKRAPGRPKVWKMSPKVSPDSSKKYARSVFLEISETLFFDDSTTILMVFWVWRGPWSSPMPQKTGRKKPIFQKCQKNGPEIENRRLNWPPRHPPVSQRERTAAPR